MPKPLNARPHKLVVYYQLWTKKRWTFHHDRRIDFKTLAEARAFASKNGYDGISVVAPGPIPKDGDFPWQK